MLALFLQPEIWAALAALIILEIVLGIDNLIFLSVVTNKLPEPQQAKARRVGILLALGFRLVLLSSVVWLVGLSAPLFDLGISGGDNGHGGPTFETAFSFRDIILIAGGLFLIWKATTEIHHKIDPAPANTVFKIEKAALNFTGAIVQIILLDAVFSIDSILTAIGMSNHLPVMVVAVITAVIVMLLLAEPLARFIKHNPTIIMLALAFLFMVGTVLIADGFGLHIPKGYIYTAMAFSMAVESLNIIARKRSILPPPSNE